MDWKETNPIPAPCRDCQEEDCYNCDTAGERWQLSKTDELLLRRKQLVKATERLQRQILAIDLELLPFNAEQRSALAGHAEMTYDMFWVCLQVCFDSNHMQMYKSIWDSYPHFSRHIREHMRNQSSDTSD